ncbi:hypothetical protein KP509_14G023000 [Ceratopteris richardii]|nr:hypothetical protein KP509_14G023000 [Ceratopteris richardii]
MRNSLDYVGRFWPVIILFFMIVLFLARPEKSILDTVSYTEADLIGKQQRGSGEKALPYPVAMALVHYATYNVTPQQTQEEIMITANILSRRGPCNFLVYGLGFDSPLWQALNYGGRTVFLEEDSSWISKMTNDHPFLTVYPVNYTTVLSEADDLLNYVREHRNICMPEKNILQSQCKLALKSLPEHLYQIKWDVIMIDAPRGYSEEFPGRMSAIYTSALMARAASREQSTDILLHDVDRPVESKYSEEFFCAKNRVEAAGKLWHFQIFGDGSSSSTDFCNGSFTAKAF